MSMLYLGFWGMVSVVAIILMVGIRNELRSISQSLVMGKGILYMIYKELDKESN
jgi:hypothetical protein